MPLTDDEKWPMIKRDEVHASIAALQALELYLDHYSIAAPFHERAAELAKILQAKVGRRPAQYRSAHMILNGVVHAIQTAQMTHREVIKFYREYADKLETELNGKPAGAD